MLNTEKRNPDTYGIDKMSTEEMLRIINNENANVTLAVEKALPEITAVCEHVTSAIKAGGRIFYMGSGTSGRLAVCDAYLRCVLRFIQRHNCRR